MAEIDRLISEIEDVDRRRAELTAQLEQAERCELIEYLDALRHFRQSLAARLPKLKRGPKSKKPINKSRFRIRIINPMTWQERLNKMIREELQRRKDENPRRAVTSGGKREASLAFELAEELKRDGYEISERTIRRIWESGGHN